jgi:hypothetical protein
MKRLFLFLIIFFPNFCSLLCPILFFQLKKKMAKTVLRFGYMYLANAADSRTVRIDAKDCH